MTLVESDVQRFRFARAGAIDLVMDIELELEELRSDNDTLRRTIGRYEQEHGQMEAIIEMWSERCVQLRKELARMEARYLRASWFS